MVEDRHRSAGSRERSRMRRRPGGRLCSAVGTLTSSPRTPHQHNPLHHAGFTLIELTVVLFLVGIFLAIAVPNVDDFLFHSDLKSTARSLKASVRLLRSKSIATGQYATLCFDLEKRTYWGELEPREVEQQTWVAAPENEVIVAPRTLPDGIRFVDVLNIHSDKLRSGRLCSILNPKGVIEETVIHMSDQRDRVLTIIINAYTGRFSLYDTYVDVEYGSSASAE